MQKPTIGRIVTVKGLDANYFDEHPAIVNRVFSKTEDEHGEHYCINVTVFPDCKDPQHFTSISLFENRARAEIYRSQFVNSRAIVAFWPDRV